MIGRLTPFQNYFETALEKRRAKSSIGLFHIISSITLGANSLVTGQLEAGTAITLGANSIVNGVVHAGAAITLGAYSVISGTAISDIGVISLGLGAAIKDFASAVTIMGPLLQLSH